MSVADHNGKMQVNYSNKTCFRACQVACRLLKGFSVNQIDQISSTIYLKGGMSLFSWGEILTISVRAIDDCLSEITVASAPKIGMGANAPGLMGDMGKNRKNIIRIQQAITAQLSKRPKEIPQQNKEISVADEIKKLASLKDEGILTEQEFSEKKRRLLNL